MRALQPGFAAVLLAASTTLAACQLPLAPPLSGFVQAKGGLYLQDPDLSTYVQRVGNSLQDGTEPATTICILNHFKAQAWVRSGDFIAISSGMLASLDNEAELAAVIAHELAHGELHAGATTPAPSSALVDREIEADKRAVATLAAAGYDTATITSLQQRLLHHSVDDISPDSRARLLASLGAASDGQGRQARRRYQQQSSMLRAIWPAYATANQAAIALERREFQLAAGRAQSALDRYAHEAAFYFLLSESQLGNGDTAAATGAALTGLAHDNSHFLGWLVLGEALLAGGETAAGRAYLDYSKTLLASARADYRLGKAAAAAGNEAGAREYFALAAREQDRWGKAAKQSLALLDLAEHPGHWLAATLATGDDGIARVSFASYSPLPLVSVDIELLHFRRGNWHTLLRERFDLALPANGNSPLYDLPLGGIEPGQLPDFKVRIVSAQPAI
jgi:predicted Zn-dependent protease